jgi:hypothetical protein
VLYGNGTRTSKYRKDGWFYYRRSFGVHTSTTRGQSQTVTAELAAPPKASSGVGLVILVLIIAIAVGGVTGLCVGFAVLILGAMMDANTGSKQSLQDWRSTFRCGRCGTMFSVTESEEPEPPVAPVEVEDSPTGVEDSRFGRDALSIQSLSSSPTDDRAPFHS